MCRFKLLFPGAASDIHSVVIRIDEINDVQISAFKTKAYSSLDYKEIELDVGRLIQIEYPLETYLIISPESNDASFTISYWYQLSFDESWGTEEGNILIPLAIVLGIFAVILVGIYLF